MLSSSSDALAGTFALTLVLRVEILSLFSPSYVLSSEFSSVLKPDSAAENSLASALTPLANLCEYCLA